MTLEKTDNPGTGNSRCRVSKETMIEYNNIEITKSQVTGFLNFLSLNGYEKAKKINVVLSNRKTSRRWGTANIAKNKVLLYRHSVWIFLHELAHLISPPKMVNGRRDIHGTHFGKALGDLFNLYRVNQEGV